MRKAEEASAKNGNSQSRHNENFVEMKKKQAKENEEAQAAMQRDGHIQMLEAGVQPPSEVLVNENATTATATATATAALVSDVANPFKEASDELDACTSSSKSKTQKSKPALHIQEGNEVLLSLFS